MSISKRGLTRPSADCPICKDLGTFLYDECLVTSTCNLSRYWNMAMLLRTETELRRSIVSSASCQCSPVQWDCSFRVAHLHGIVIGHLSRCYRRKRACLGYPKSGLRINEGTYTGTDKTCRLFDHSVAIAISEGSCKIFISYLDKYRLHTS